MKKSTLTTADTSLPFISIIMPIRNEASFIDQSLNAVLRQDYPADRMEVLVVDGMSTDGTREMVKKIIAQSSTEEKPAPTSDKNGILIRLLDNPEQIVPTALNIGLRQARGEIIIRVDGHCEIATDYINRCLVALHRIGADCAGGPIRTISEGWIGRAIAKATSSPFGVGNARFRYTKCSGWVDTVSFGAYRRDVFDRIGLFDEELKRNQDDEFNYRLLQSGRRIWLDINIHSVYYSRGTIKNLCRQYFEYGMYKVRVIQKRGAVPSIRHLVPGGFVLAVAASVILALFLHNPMWLVPVLGLYLLVNVLVSLWTARRNPRIAFILPVAFLCVHVSYGLGFLWGIWKWRRFFSAKNMFKGQR